MIQKVSKRVLQCHRLELLIVHMDVIKKIEGRYLRKAKRMAIKG